MVELVNLVDLNTIDISAAIGPALPLILGGASLLGKLFGGASQGRAAGRAAENDAALNRDRLAQSQYATDTNARLTERSQGLQGAESQQSADVAKLLFSILNPQQRTGQVAMGDILSRIGAGGAGMKPNSMPSRIPKFNVGSGLGLSALGPTSQMAGNAMKLQALQALLSGSDVQKYPTPNFAGAMDAAGGARPTAPRPTPVSQPNWLDKVLNIGSAIGTGAGALGALGVGGGGGGGARAAAPSTGATQFLNPNLARNIRF